jgi:hypothetical protein
MWDLRVCLALALATVLGGCGGGGDAPGAPGSGTGGTASGVTAPWQIATVGVPGVRDHGDSTVVGFVTDRGWRVFNVEDGVAEYAYDGEAWRKTIVAGTYDDDRQLLVADARGDGRARLYVRGSAMRECEPGPASWSCREIPSPGGAVSPGDPRGEGHASFYSLRSNLDTALEEVRFRGGEWVRTVIDPAVSPAPSFPRGVAAGDARRDGRDRLYIPTTRTASPGAGANAEILEYAAAGGSAWERTVVRVPWADVLGNWYVLGVFAAHGGQKALYSYGFAGANHELHELLFDAGEWQHVAGHVASNLGGSSFAGGDGRGDGMVRLYSAGDFGQLTENSYSAAGWSTAHIVIRRPDAAALSTVAIGPGRGDARPRVYVQRFDLHSPNDLVELTYP